MAVNHIDTATQTLDPSQESSHSTMGWSLTLTQSDPGHDNTYGHDEQLSSTKWDRKSLIERCQDNPRIKGNPIHIVRLGLHRDTIPYYGYTAPVIIYYFLLPVL